MSVWSGSDVTNQGLDLIAQSQTGGSLTFTRIGLGSGLIGQQDPAALTDLVKPETSVDIKRAEALAFGSFEIGGEVLPGDIAADFFWQEVGVYAHGADGVEKLYAYSWALLGQASLVSADSIDGMVLKLPVYIGNAQNVTASIDLSAVYLLQSEGQELREEIFDGATGVYEHEKSGTVHNFTGAGRPMGRALITAPVEPGDAFAVNGTLMPAFVGETRVESLPVNRWVLFINDGFQLNFFSGAPGDAKELSFTYTGSSTISAVGPVMYMKLLTSGTLTPNINGVVDTFMVGGGGGGSAGGAGGGYTKTNMGISVSGGIPIACTIGAGGGGVAIASVGGTGGTTSFGGNSIGGGAGGGNGTSRNGGNGGSGGGPSGGGGANVGGNGGSNGSNGTASQLPYTVGVGQGTTTREFGSSTAALYSGGGGGAGLNTAGTGGAGGGGNGSASYGLGGGANTGGGGGGGGNAGANGGSGIIILRWVI